MCIYPGKIHGTKATLVEEFEQNLKKGCRHLYTVVHQYKAIRQLKEKLGAGECVMQTDFSENFNCKYSQDIQSVHFGASNQQASLHTSVVYSHGGKVNLSFCTISDCCRHDPPAI